jgi:ATP-binding cassette subfamily B protein
MVKNSLQRYRYLLAKYFIPFWQQVLLLGLLLFIGVALSLVNPQILKNFIDLAATRAPTRSLIVQALWFLGAAVLLQVISVFENWLATNLGLLSTNRLRADLTLHCLNLDMTFHKAHTPGEMIERVDGDVGTLGNFLSRFIVEILGSLLLMLGTLVLMYFIDWRVGLVFSLFCGITLAVLARLEGVAVPHYRKSRQANADLYGFLEDRISGTEDVRANGAVRYVLHRFHEYSRPVWRTEVTAFFVGHLAFGSAWILFAIGSAISLAMGVYLYQQGQITLGTVYLIFRYAELLYQPLENLIRQFSDLQKAGASAIRILDLLHLQSNLPDTGTQEIPVNQSLALTFDHVSFAYQDQAKPGTVDTTENSSDNVLADLNFDLPPGKILGLLGRTGSGKTSLARLLVRFYDPQEGVIKLDDIPIKEIPQAVLRQRVALVTQEIQLFNASLRDNLSLFDPGISDERILAAFDELGLMDWYKSLPDGLGTRLEPGGSRLSAGEAQLLAFVRIFLRNPGLIILDEASSRLDPATEARLERAIERLLRDRSAIIIAHRLGTVQRADHILILEAGHPSEYGRREELAKDPHSHFAALMRTGLQEVLA